MSATITNNKVMVTTSFDLDELWLAITGSCFANTNYWIRDVELDTWDSPCDLVITHSTENEMATTTTTITIQQLADSFAQLLQKNTTHCGGYPISDFDTSDSCIADFVLQQAIFGDVIFG